MKVKCEEYTYLNVKIETVECTKRTHIGVFVHQIDSKINCLDTSDFIFLFVTNEL